MLKLVNLQKDYVLKDQPVVHALKGVSVNFRRNEFVAILGPSGCGKTTLLNLIGGLDRYTDGDLVIEGKSTKKYTDHDWDTYRNHSIGFVFQAYNLIGHQSILNNVELALTISGISRKERKQRAKDALDRVGLAGLYGKKPNQLSGGQMQRVAIARSLVNNPEILLADEPTGALDSETSIQIMDLLKEVAQDRLVIMVTHNPELAYKYANRIVTMKDGVVLDDSNPFEGETEEQLTAAIENKKQIIAQKGKNKSSMSFAAATGLSFANLISKLKRTILVTIAGSIGIIGVSAVLAVSTGVTSYVDKMQDDMLSSYPLKITETAVDLTSLMSGLSNWDQKEIAEIDFKNKVAVDSMIAYLMEKYADITSVKTNDINDNLIAYLNNMPADLLSSIDYNYGVDLTNNVFASWKRDETFTSPRMMSLNGLTQMYISELMTVDDFKEYAAYVDLFTNFMNQLPGGEEYILQQYDLVGANSRFANKADEIMLVVDDNQTLTDITLAQLGFFREDQFLNIARYAVENNKENPDEEKLAKYDYPRSFEIEEILGKELMYYPHDSIYKFVKKDVESVDVTFKQVAGEETNTFKFELEYDESIDALVGDITAYVSGSKIEVPDVQFTRTSVKDPASHVVGDWNATVYGMINFTISLSEDASHNRKATLTSTMAPLPLEASYTYSFKNKDAYRYNADATGCENGTPLKIVGILKAKETTNFGCLSRGVYYTPELTRKYINDSRNSQIIANPDHGLLSYIGSDAEANSNFRAYATYTYTSYKYGEDSPIFNREGEAMCLNLNTAGNLSSLFGGGASNYKDYDKAFLRALSGLACKERLENSNIVYEYDDLPNAISIYPKDFTKKDKILKYIDKWNVEGTLDLGEGATLAFEDREEITYVDTIGIIINVVDTLINAITIALVSFTSLSLVVSCFMIAVITYISTMERFKEIGIIRSLGGRKKDVSRLFIAECLIIGLASGVFGIAITYVLCAILNAIVLPFGVGTIAVLLPQTVGIMIALSVVLNVLSGLVPSMRASTQDPVIALRSE